MMKMMITFFVFTISCYSSPLFAGLLGELLRTAGQALIHCSYGNTIRSELPFLCNRGVAVLSNAQKELITKVANDCPATSEDLVATYQRYSFLKDTPPIEIKSGLQKMEQKIQEAPIHIGFVANRLFDKQGNFFPGGQYGNKYVRGQQPRDDLNLSNEHVDSLSPTERPIYGALNLSGQGHEGWGNSAIVLQPQIRANTLLRSRDSGTKFIGDWVDTAEFTESSYNQVEKIVGDFKEEEAHAYWKSNVEGEQTSSHGLKYVEANIHSENGRIDSSDMALLIVDQNEVTQNISKEEATKRLQSLERFSSEKGVPIIMIDSSKGQLNFQKNPLYQSVLKSYKEKYFQEGINN
ncbi:MAG: hypothetical protein HQK50_08545 [Oligoflexia bacterium]|nr:hypothetical protein [Oligoflexia bacterium]